MGDIENAVRVVSANWGIFAALGLIVYGAYRGVRAVQKGVQSFKAFIGAEIEERLPKVLKQEFANGLGTMLQGKLDGVLRQHEERENANLREVMHDHLTAYHPRTARRR